LSVTGTGLVLLDGVLCTKGAELPLNPRSTVTLATQTDTSEVLSLVALAVHYNPSHWADVYGEVRIPSLKVPEDKDGAHRGVSEVQPPVVDQCRLLQALRSMSEQSKLPKAHPTDSWILECIFALGLSAKVFESVPRVLALFFGHDSSPLVLGREHQPELFQALLAGSPDLCTHVSRNHLKLEACASDADGLGTTLKVINEGQLDVLIDGHISICRGQHSTLRHGQILSFTCPGCEAGFLAFRLQASAPSSQQSKIGPASHASDDAEMGDVTGHHAADTPSAQDSAAQGRSCIPAVEIHAEAPELAASTEAIESTKTFPPHVSSTETLWQESEMLPCAVAAKPAADAVSIHHEARIDGNVDIAAAPTSKIAPSKADIAPARLAITDLASVVTVTEALAAPPSSADKSPMGHQFTTAPPAEQPEAASVPLGVEGVAPILRITDVKNAVPIGEDTDCASPKDGESKAALKEYRGACRCFRLLWRRSPKS
jgi:hypothetical protein